MDACADAAARLLVSTFFRTERDALPGSVGPEPNTVDPAMRITSSWRLPLLASCTVALFAACAPAASGGASAGASAGAGTSSVRRSNVLTREELAGSGTSNLYDAINRLRPQWLRGSTNTQTRTGGGGLSVVVYQGTTQLGGVEVLRQMAPSYVATIRYLEGNQASNTLPGLGSRVVAGAIVLELPRD